MNNGGSVAPKIFRARKLDFSRPLLVFKEQNFNVEEESLVSVVLPSVSTGVEKEEEEELHLKEILKSLPSSISAKKVIPTPKINKNDISTYNNLYPIIKDPRDNKVTQIEEKNHKVPDELYPIATYYEAFDFPELENGNDQMCGRYGIGGEATMCVLIEKQIGENTVPYCLKDEDYKIYKKIKNSLGGEKLTEDIFEALLWIFNCIKCIGLTKYIKKYGKVEIDLKPIRKLLRNYIPNKKDEIDAFLETSNNSIIQKILNYSKELCKDKKSILDTIKIKDEKGESNDQYVCFRAREIKNNRRIRRGDGINQNKAINSSQILQISIDLFKMAMKRDEIRMIIAEKIVKQCKNMKEVIEIMKKDKKKIPKDEIIKLLNLFRPTYQKDNIIRRVPQELTLPKCPYYKKVIEASLFLSKQPYYSLWQIYIKTMEKNGKKTGGKGVPSSVFTSSAPWATFFKPMDAMQSICTSLFSKYEENGMKANILNDIIDIKKEINEIKYPLGIKRLKTQVMKEESHGYHYQFNEAKDILKNYHLRKLLPMKEDINLIRSITPEPERFVSILAKKSLNDDIITDLSEIKLPIIKGNALASFEIFGDIKSKMKKDYKIK